MTTSEKKEFRPPVKLSGDQVEQAKSEMLRLIETFGPSGLAYLMGASTGAVFTMKSRGYISAQAAHELCKMDTVKNEGFTREKLRPDVKVWYIDDLE